MANKKEAQHIYIERDAFDRSIRSTFLDKVPFYNRLLGIDHRLRHPFQYGIQPLVYRGSEWFAYSHRDAYRNEAHRLYRNDHLVYLSMPEIVTGINYHTSSKPSLDPVPLTTEASLDGLTDEQFEKRRVAAWAKLYDCILSEVKERYKHSYYIDAVLLDLPETLPDEIETRLRGVRKIRLNWLMEDKRFKAKNPDQNLLITPIRTSPESPNNISFRPKVPQERSNICTEDFQGLAAYLPDQQFKAIMKEAKRDGLTFEEQLVLEKMAIQRLHQIIYQELSERFAGSEVTGNRNPDTNLPARGKKFSWLQLYRMQNGEMAVRIGKSDRTITVKPLEKILFKEGEDPWKLFYDDKTSPAQTAYLFDYMLIKEKPEPIFIPQKTPTEQEIFRELDELGLKIQVNRNNLRSMVTGRRDWKEYLRDTLKGSMQVAKDYALPAAAAVSISIIISAIILNAGILKRLPQFTIDTQNFIPTPVRTIITETRPKADPHNPEATVGVNKSHKAAFPDSISSTPASPQWQLESRGGFSLAGYYTTETSHEITPSAEWENVTQIDHPVITLPNDSDKFDTEHGIILTTSTRLSRIKIPIKDHTRLHALKVTKDNKPIRFSSYILKDGTLMLEIPENVGLVNIGVILVPDEIGQVYSAGKLNQAIESAKLTQKAWDLVTRISRLQRPDSYERIAQIVRNNYEYSLDPKNKKLLDAVTSPTDRLNAIAELSGCTCDICTEINSLLSSLAQDPNRTLSRATGYLHSIPNTGERGSYLSADSYHAYNITSKGEIIDSTPSDIANDSLTQAYINKLNSSSNQDLTKSQIPNPDKPKESPRDNSLLERLAIAGLLLTGIGIGVRYFPIDYIRRHWPKTQTTPESIEPRRTYISFTETKKKIKPKKKIITEKEKPALNLSNEDLDFGYYVLCWLCWAPDNAAFNYSPNINIDKEQILKSASTLSSRVLKEHIKNPGLLQRRINLSDEQQQKVQHFIAYLLGR